MRLFLFLGALSGFIGVGLGAFGAHGLEGTISEAAITNWEKAVQYQMYHTLALLAVGLLFATVRRRSLHWAGWLFCAGIILFSGSLYAYALTGVTTIALITPFGGVAFLTGWILLAYTAVTVR